MRLLLASPIAPEAIELLRSRHDVVLGFDSYVDLVDLVADREGLVFRSGVDVTRQVIEAADDLQLMVRAGSGLDNIDLRAARQRGIRVARVPGASPEAVAELTLGLMLAAVRHISRADALIRRGQWPKYELGGSLIADKTMGIIGAGRIGSRAGALCAALGMRVLGCVKHPSPDRESELARMGIKLADIDTVIAESDVVSIHTPLKDSTRHLIDAGMLERMRPGAVLINTARGGVVDEAAVYAALTGGRLRAAAFDVHEREGDGVVPALAELPNVVLTPHIGGMAVETQRVIGLRVAEIVEAYLGGLLDDVLTAEEFVL